MAKKKTAKKKTTKKDQSAIKEQYTSTGYLNALAAQVLHPLRSQAGALVQKDFYPKLLRLFRRVPHHDSQRWLLLRGLRNMEVNYSYPLSKFGVLDWNLKMTGKKIIVTLDIVDHPKGKTRNHQGDCYYFEIILLAWTETGIEPKVLINETDWIKIDGDHPGFDLPLDKPAGINHWLLFVHGLLGKNQVAIDTVETRGVRCVGAGTFDKKDITAEEKWMKEQTKAAAAIVSNKRVKKEGVKPKKKKKR